MATVMMSVASDAGKRIARDYYGFEAVAASGKSPPSKNEGGVPNSRDASNARRDEASFSFNKKATAPFAFCEGAVGSCGAGCDRRAELFYWTTSVRVVFAVVDPDVAVTVKV